jgi:prepilin-type N-terminal cleavage/methylation domain-containing protein
MNPLLRSIPAALSIRSRERQRAEHSHARFLTGGRQAFTLVELLAAMAVLAVLMAIIFGIFNQASKAWILAESRTENFQSARAALDLMCRELEGAMVGIRTNANGTRTRVNIITFENSGAAAIPTDSGTFTPTFATGYSSLNATPPNDAIFFITQAPDSKSSGSYIDMAECGYFVGFSTATSANGGIPKGFYGLLRHYARSSSDASWDFFSSPNNWWSTEQAVKTPLLENVIRFELRYEYIHHGAGITNGTSICENWNTITGGPDPAYVPDPTTQLPRAFHLRLSVMDRRYAARAALLMPAAGLDATELGKVPYSMDTMSNQALSRTLKEGMRTFFRSVYPRGAS